MKVLVVFESMYGNTAAVAEAIAASLGAHGLEVRAGPVTEIGPAEATEAGLLVVGGPTHVHAMSRATTRKTAVEDEKNTYAHPTLTPGLREWIDELPAGAGRLAAAFDTRIDKAVLLTGSAAKGIARRLSRRGLGLVVEPESFFVSTDNRLLDGEIDHAKRWGYEVAGATQAARARRPAV